MNSQVVIDFIARAAHLRSGVGQVVQSLDAVDRSVRRVRQGLAIGGAAIGAGLTAAAYKAAGFQREMQNVNSIVQDSDKVFARTSAGVLDLATKIPQAADELARGAYQIVSAGFTGPRQTLDILAQSGKAASAGLTDVKTSSLAIVTAMNAYGGAAGNATRVSDLLFKTVEVGQVSFEQLATNIGDFIGIANASGAKLSETLSAYSSITIATGQASRSATSLQGIYRQLIKPTDTLKARLNSLGYASGKAAIESDGLQTVLERLTKGLSTEAVAEMFQDVEGLNGVLALTGPNADKARASLEKFTKESEISGATQRALAQQSKSFSYQMQQLKSTLGAVGIEFGQIFLPAMKMGVTLLNTMAQGLHAIPGPVKTILGVLAAFASFMGTIGLSMLIWNARLKMVRMGMNALGATNVMSGLMSFVRGSTIAQGALTILTTKLGITRAALTGLAGAAGVGLGALIGVPMAVKAIQNALSPQKIDKAASALLKWGDAGSYAGTRLTDQFGDGLQGIARDIETFTTGNEGLWAKLTPKGLSPAVRRIDELDKAFAKLVTSGNVNAAKRQFDIIDRSLRNQGFTTAQINQAFNDYLGVLGDIELQNRAAGDEQLAMADAVETTGEAMKRAEEEAEAYAERIEDLRGQTKEFLSISGVMGKVEETHRAAFDAAEKARRKLEEQRDRAREVSKAQGEMAKAQEKVNRITAQQPIPGTKGWRELKDAQEDVADAADRLRGSAASVNEEYKKTAPTISELVQTFQAQIDKYKSFQTNLYTAAARGVPIEVIEQLRGMGEEGVELASLLAKAPPKEFDKLKGVLAEKVRLEGQAYQKQLDADLVTAAAIARKGAGATVQAILEEVRKIAPGIAVETPAIRTALGNLGLAVIEDAKGINQSVAGLLPQVAGPPDPRVPGGGLVKPKSSGTLSPFAGQSYDTGGILRPQQIAVNTSPLPEYIFTAAQMRALVPKPQKGGTVAGSSTTITNRYEFGDIYAQDLTGAMRQAEQKRRLGALAGG